MPLPLSENGQHAIKPKGFDPAKHCGAYTRNNNSLCMNMAGANTDHLGDGRCSLHGGLTPVVNGARSKLRKFRRTSLEERADEIYDGEDLLSMDREIAQTKAVSEEMFKRFAQRVEVYGRIMEAAEDGEYDDVGGPPSFEEIVGKEFPMDLMKLANTMVTTSYNMKFSKRFSIPVTELESVIRQIVDVFNEMCKMFEIPEAAVLIFQDRMRALKISRQLDDRALMKAGADRAIRVDQILELEPQSESQNEVDYEPIPAN